MLLRAIDKKAVTGHGQPERAVNVRLLAATLEPLPQAVATGRFRRDLWFRLAGQIIEIPPLRDRMPELPALCSAILGTIDEGLTLHEGGGIHETALARLRQETWPGNVRELATVLRRAVRLANGEQISERHLVFNPTPTGPIAALSPVRRRNKLTTARVAAARAVPHGRQNRALVEPPGADPHAGWCGRGRQDMILPPLCRSCREVRSERTGRDPSCGRH